MIDSNGVFECFLNGFFNDVYNDFLNDFFDVPIRSGTELFPVDPLFILLDSFYNSRIHNCAGGSKCNAKITNLRAFQM